MNSTGQGGWIDVLPADRLSAFSAAILADAGADEPTASDATRAMLYASLHGIDSPVSYTHLTLPTNREV